MSNKSDILGAIDFGSHMVRAVVARKNEDGVIQILGHGTSPGSDCVSQGVVQDQSAAQTAVKRAFDMAETEAREQVDDIYCGINGLNVETFIREEKVQLDEEIVERAHITEALEMASRDVVDLGKRVISSVTAQEWYVDDLRVRDPHGIRGHVLKARIHFARVPSVVEDNIVHCLASQRRELRDLIFHPLASSLGCLTPEDTELGVAVLDIGRSTAGLAVHRDRRVLSSHCFAWGGYHITRDVAAGLQISFEEADLLILEYGIPERPISSASENGKNSTQDSIEEDTENAEIKLKTAVHGAPNIVSRARLDMIIYERANELMTQVRQHFQSRGLTKHLIRGVVITGGAANIKRIGQLGEAIFQVPCRIGVPNSIDILPAGARSPEFSNVIGIARHGFYHRSVSGNRRRGPVANSAKKLTVAFKKYFF